MKVILTDDIESLGKIGDIKEVKSGFARNYLFPKNIAIEVTPSNLKIWEAKKLSIKKKEAEERKEAESFAERIKQVTCKIPVKVGEDDKLFGSVTSQNISDTLSKLDIQITKKDISLESPIKTIGTHQVSIKLHPNVTVEIDVEIVKSEE